MIKLFIKPIICLLVMLTVTAPLVSQENNQAVTQYKVTVLVFSGRPNPTYMIEQPEAVKELNQDLSTTIIPEPDQQYLNQTGYVGLIIEGFVGNKKISEVIIPSKPSQLQKRSLTKSVIDTGKIKSLEEKILKYGKNK